jgi:hypothetical protein
VPVQPKRRRLGVVGALLAGLLATATALAAAPASAAPIPKPKGHIVLKTVRTAKIVTPKSPSAPTCTPGQGTITRTASCSTGTITVEFIDAESGEVKGTADISYTSSVTLDPRNRYKWTNDVSLKLTNPTIPEANAVEGTVTEDCSACSATPGGTRLLLPNTTQTYSMTLSSPGRNVVTDPQAPLLTVTAPTYDTGSVDLGNKLTVRCDNTPRMSPVATGGCVYSDVIPTYVLSTTGPYDQVAWHVAWAQANLKNHWGKQGAGPALERTMNRTLIRANRRTACPSSIPRPSGKSCDEYPFASTYQGASLNPTDFSCHMVPATQNSNEGSYRRTWYNANRLFDKDKFWVDVTLPPANAPAVMRPFVQCPG